MLALTGTARRWEPRRLRLRLFPAAGRLARGCRMTLLSATRDRFRPARGGQPCLYWSKSRLLALNWAFMLRAGIR